MRLNYIEKDIKKKQKRDIGIDTYTKPSLIVPVFVQFNNLLKIPRYHIS